jgi:type I restriction enzyme R subunit
VLLRGVFERRRFLDLVRHFVVFEETGGGKLAKKMAGYHQFHAVNVAVEETALADREGTAAFPQKRDGPFVGR